MCLEAPESEYVECVSGRCSRTLLNEQPHSLQVTLSGIRYGSASPLQLRWWRAPPAGPPRRGLCPQGTQARGMGETGHASSPYTRSARPGHRKHPSDLAALVWTSQCRNICVHVVILNDSSKYCSILFIKIHSPAFGQTCNNSQLIIINDTVSQHCL